MTDPICTICGSRHWNGEARPGHGRTSRTTPWQTGHCGVCGHNCGSSPDGFSTCEWRALVLPVLELGGRVAYALDLP